MRKFLILSVVSLLAMTGVWGQTTYTATMDGAVYSFTVEGMNATLTRIEQENAEEGAPLFEGVYELAFPATVSVNSVDYRVTTIDIENLFGIEVRSLSIPATVERIDCECPPAVRKFTFYGEFPPQLSGTWKQSMTEYGKVVYVPLQNLTLWKEALKVQYENEIDWGQIVFLPVENVIGGIHYVLDHDTHTAYVAGNPYGSTEENGYSGDIVIPETAIYEDVEYTVTEIGDNAFQSQFSITSVDIPATVTKIGEMALYKNVSLQSLICRAVVPPATSAGVESIDYSICYEVPLYVPAESVDAYRAADMWKEFRNILPIGADMVEADGLWYILYPDNTAMVIPSANDMYQGDYVVPETVSFEDAGYTVTAVGDGAFQELQYAIPNVTLPATITSIGQSAFGLYYYDSDDGSSDPRTLTCHAAVPPATQDTENDRYVTFNEQYTLYVTLRVPYAALDAYRTTLPWSQFHNIEAIPETMPEYVTEGYVEYVLDPESGKAQVTGLSNECPENADITILPVVNDRSGDITSYEVTAIKDFAFSRTAKLNSVTIPASIKSIGGNAFFIEENLTQIICLGEPASALEDAATATASAGTFSQWCFDNVELVVPSYAEQAYRTTAPWSKFRNIKWNVETDDTKYVVSDGIRYLLDERDDGTPVATAVGVEEMAAEMKVRATVADAGTGREHTVVALGDWLFSQRYGIMSICIPGTIETIGSGAFYGISSLERIWCDAPTPPAAVISDEDTGAFGSFDEHCFGQVSLIVSGSSVAGIYRQTAPYASFRNIDFVVLEEEVGYKPNEEDGTAEVTANPNVGYEGKVVIDAAVTDDEGNEYTVTSIADEAFAGQEGMTSVVIPETVETIGSAVFDGCSGLTEIECLSATPPAAISGTDEAQQRALRAAGRTGGAPTFSDWCFDNVRLVVPVGSLEAYKGVEPWRSFKTIVEKSATGIVAPAGDADFRIVGDMLYAGGTHVQVYDMTGRIVYCGDTGVALRPGVYIVKAGGRSVKVQM